jgi:hypothetical protein
VTANTGDNNTPLKTLQTTGDLKRKASPDFGLEVARHVSSLIQNAYFTERNRRFARNRALANGRMDLAPIKAQFGIEAKNYTQLSFKAIMVVSTIISRLVGRWMQNREKLEVKAVDDYSEAQRKQEYEEAEFTMNHADMLAHLQQKTGLPMVAQNQYIPEDKEDLDLWKKELQRLPEEILFEQGENDILEDSGWFDIIKEKCLKDAAEVGLIACEIVNVEDGEIAPKYVLPEATFYSNSDFPDFRDASLKGYEEAMKIIDIRAQYPRLPEEKYWQLAQQSSQFRSSDLHYKGYDSSWNSCDSRPYDDFVVPVLKYWLKTIDKEIHEKETTRYGSVRVKVADKVTNPNKQYITKDEYTIYKGVFVKGTEVLLEWGEQKNMIRPHDPQESGNAECPLCLIMYNQQDMRNLAVPEKIEYPVEQMLVTLFKIQQLVVELVPPGNAYNIDAIRELDMGLGEGNEMKPLEVRRMYKQSGDFMFTGRDAKGDPLEFPITPLANATAFQQLQGLITTYNFYQQVLRDEVGINENAEGQTPKARVTTDNYQSSVQLSYNATDYMYNAYLYLMEDAGKKIGCLLWNSVRLGTKAYRKLLKVEDVKDRIFKTRAKMLPTEEQQAYLDGMVNQAMVSNPSLILHLDPFKIRRLAKDNIKLAEQYFYLCQKKAIQGAMEQAQQQSQMNSQAQTESAKAANEGLMQLEELKAKIVQAQEQQRGTETQKAAIISMVTQLYSKGEQLPGAWKPLESALIQNLIVPLVAANQQQQQAIMQQLQQQAAQQPPQEAQPPEAQPPEQQPDVQMG